MKKLLVTLVMLLCIAQQAVSQSRITFAENFDGVVSYTSSPASAWEKDTNYYVSPPNAYLGMVPNAIGATSVLETPVYDFSNHANILLRFKHICKISPRDTVRIEYKIRGQTWKPIPVAAYLGKAIGYRTNGFSASSYLEWQASDSLALPPAPWSWWREEAFDVSGDVGLDDEVQFRFLIKHGNTPGTQVSYGWLLDNMELIAFNAGVIPPVVEFIAPFMPDTVYTTGPHTIHAQVKTSTTALIENPWLNYTATRNGTVIATDSVLMTHVQGDSLWRASIPEFLLGAEVRYSITGRDTFGNYTMISSAYFIKKLQGVLTGLPLSTMYYAPADTTGGTASNAYIVFYTRGPNSWSRTLYLRSELVGNTPLTEPLAITKIAWYNRSSIDQILRQNIEIYMEATTATANTAVYMNPAQNASTLVYRGPVTTCLQWNEVTLNTPFVLPAGSNLMVYFEDKSDVANTTSLIGWAGHAVTNRTVYPTTAGVITLGSSSPLMRFGIYALGDFGANSVALTSIDSPLSRISLGGVSTPVQVSIRNKGDSTLTSVLINWSVNGVVQTPYAWTGNLSWDFETQVTIGNYLSRMEGYDTVNVWVSLPNGVADVVLSDDSLEVTPYGCLATMSGATYTVGANGIFPTLNDAFTTFASCIPTGDITLAMESGIYPENWDFSNLSNIMGGYTLTITSAANNSDSVILRPSSGVGITLANIRDLVLKAITVDVAAGTGTRYAIQFTDACTNVVIRDCKLLANPTIISTTNAPVYKAGIGIVDSIFFINNLLDGGYYGIYFYGGTSISYYGSNVVFDSNTVSNNAGTAIYPYYLHFTSCSYNTILSRTANIQTTWTAISMSYCNGPVIGNRVIQRSNAITNPCGIYLSLSNNYLTTDTGLVSNNEFILNTTGAYYAIRVASTSRAKIIHNSVYITGTGAGRGIHIDNQAAHILLIKNNNIVLTSPTSHPIYFWSTIAMNMCDIDYNNFYAPQYIGYYGKNRTSFPDWRQQVNGDWHSVRVLPAFVNPTTSLELQHNGGLSCYLVPPVSDDILSTPRAALATMGCYELPPMSAGGRLAEITGLPSGGGGVVGNTDTVKTVVYNTGTTPLTSVNLGWSINGSIQNAGTNYPVALAAGESATINVGTITYPGIDVTITVWINTLNQGALTDGFLADDTVSLTIVHCANAYSGIFTVGTTGYFPSIEAAFDAIRLCGANGDITLEIQSGTYNTSIDLTDNSAVFGNHKLTLTSVTGIATSTIIRSTTTAITLGNTNNVTIKALTFDATSGTYGMDFLDACTNILVRDCRILASPTTTSTSFAVRKANGTGIVDSIFFINNTIDGGYYGFQFYGGTGSTVFGTNVIFDSNTVSNQYYYSFYPNYVDFISCSYNTILSRTTSTSNSWYATNITYCNGPIVGNRITQRSNAITSPLGLYLSGYNRNSNDTGLIANNELILNTTITGANAISGINVGSDARAKVINNSLYMSGIGDARGLYIGSSATRYIIAKNNNIVLTSPTAYPIYFNNTNYMQLNDIDYNNLYAPTYIGYVGGTGITDKATWRQQTGGDYNSVRVLPSFVNLATNLEFMHNDTLSCSSYPEVPMDIRGISRLTNTNMGAYTLFSNGQDFMLKEVVSWNKEVIDKQTVAIDVTVLNVGIVPITSALFGWSINGTPQANVPWTATPQLNSLDQRTVSIGSFPVTSGISNYNIVVWIETANGIVETIHWNDTLRVSTTLSPLAEFASPFIADTILSASFTVNTLIRAWTGATLTPPKMTIVSTTGAQITYDTILMVKVGDLWRAIIPAQYHGTKVVYSIKLTDTLSPVANSITLIDSTYIRDLSSILGNPALAALSLADPLTIPNIVCTGDSSAVNVELQNKSTADYNFGKDTLLIRYEITNPMQYIYSGSVPYTSSIAAGTTSMIELMPALAVFYAGSYTIKVWVGNPLSNILYMDTLVYTYISNRVALPIDDNFSSGIATVFNIEGNTTALWQQIADGMITDTAVHPVFGSGVLAFVGSRGAMTMLSTRQMDLSQTIQPSLSFWYFHDTIPCKDYMDVRITIDGGATFTTLYSLTKYDAVYGWKQYSSDLPTYAVNQCVALVFEAMEKSNGYVTQYIDRILITARQDIEVREIIFPELTGCDMQNKDVKVVLGNLGEIALNYANTPTIVTIEIKETGDVLKDTLTSGSLGSFATDTITVARGIDFAPGTYTFKAYFTSISDVNRQNDTLVTSFVVNPALSVRIRPESGGTTNCLQGDGITNPSIVITNTGNLPLSDIDLKFYVLINGVDMDSVIESHPINNFIQGDSVEHILASGYSIPWTQYYLLRAEAYLSCDSAQVNASGTVSECVDVTDLALDSILSPSGSQIDVAGSLQSITVSLKNRSLATAFPNVKIRASIVDSKGNITAPLDETILFTIRLLSDTTYTFATAYTVPNDTAYSIIVSILDENGLRTDNYQKNDTIKAIRKTDYVGIAETGNDRISMSQNIPNPSNGTTRIDYSLPTDGEVIFHVYTTSGQELFNQVVETTSGKHSIDLNTTHLASGIYFYSMEFKGQRIVKRMSVAL